MFKIKLKKKKIVSIILILFFIGCASYRETNKVFFENVYSENYEEAENFLTNTEEKVPKRDKILFDLNKASVKLLKSENKISADQFIQIDKEIEDFSKNAGDIAKEVFVNPSVVSYRVEEYESIMLNYYNVINFLMMSNFESALVECKRAILKIYNLKDKYGDKLRYKDDAFMQNLVGMIYEATGDYNNAFIAYRNSLNVYKEFYSKEFKIQVPHQLKLDLIHSARKTGLTKEANDYMKEFSITDYEVKNDEGSLIIIWNNGVIPHKEEFSINFVPSSGVGGGLIIKSPEDDEFSGVIAPNSVSDGDKKSILSVGSFRLALPKLVQDKSYYNTILISIGDKNYNLEYAQDLGMVAKKSLKDRLVKDLANAMVRIAVKKAIEVVARETLNKEKDGLGSLVGSVIGLASMATEKADTRNWQILPKEIHYTRINLPEGQHSINVSLNGVSTFNKSVNKAVKKNKIEFLPLFSLRIIEK